MGTTANNGWTYPESTDLVKDGATAIQTLADDIDTTLGVYSAASAGLVLLNTTNFSGVSSQSVNDVFSATYDNYKIVLTGTSTTNDNIGLRLRVSGTDATATNYSYQRLSADSTSVGGARSNSQAQFFLNLDTVYDSGSNVELYKPFGSNMTAYRVVSAFEISGGSIYDFSGVHGLTTSYTGFTLFKLVSGNMTGSVSTYGYSK